MWTFDEIKEWFGCDLDAKQAQLLAQYRVWASRYEDKVSVLNLAEKQIDRNAFELFLQDRELSPVRMAALRWGMDVASFMACLQAALQKGLISEGQEMGEFPGVFRSSFVADFYKRFHGLARMTFATYSGFVRLFHAEIETQLDVHLNQLICPTSQAFGEVPPEFGYAFDCITSEPIGLGYQIWLETNKPIQLPLDGCSWLTMERFYDLLKNSVLGILDERFEENRELLHRSIQF